MSSDLPVSIAARRQVAEATLREVLRGRGMALIHLTSRYRWPEYVAARFEAANKLHAMGFKRVEIAGYLRKDPSTVWYYLLSPSERQQENGARSEVYHQARQSGGAA